MSCLTPHHVHPVMFFLASINGRIPRIRIAMKSNYTSKFVWDCSKNCVDPEEVSFWFNVGRSDERVCGDKVFRLEEKVWKD